MKLLLLESCMPLFNTCAIFSVHLFVPSNYYYTYAEKKRIISIKKILNSFAFSLRDWTGGRLLFHHLQPFICRVHLWTTWRGSWRTWGSTIHNFGGKKGEKFCESLQKLLMIFCSIPREAVVEAAKALALMGLGWLLLIVGAEEAALLGI